MSKSTKILLLTLCGISIVAGFVLMMFYAKSNVCGGLSCIFLGIGMIVLGIHNKYQYEEKLEELTESVDEFMLEVKNTHDEDYDMKNENKAVKKAYGQLKKTDRTHISLFISGIVLFFLAILIF